MSTRTLLVVVGAGTDEAFDMAGAVGERLGNHELVETVAVVRCSDATAEALLDSLEDEVAG